MSDLEHALPKGTRIAGYEITGYLGAGGFGITYSAFNRFTDRQVAIKEFFPFGVASRSTTSTGLQVFEGQEETLGWALRKFEATTADLCRLSHPNIVGVIDYYPGNGTGFMVMEHLRGMTLEDWLERREQPPRPSELAPLMEPVLDALEYLHSRGLVHRDISPDNIFICEDNRPVLIDFGSASHDRSIPGSAPRSTVIIKKKSFTAPDQSRGLSLPNPTADVYSLGAVLYQALSGKPPVDGEDRMVEILLGEDPYRSLEAAPPTGTSRAMGRAIDQCLMPDASARPQSIRAARRLFDWRDDYEGRDAGHVHPADDLLHLQDFSFERDVISITPLDELDPAHLPAREQGAAPVVPPPLPPLPQAPPVPPPLPVPPTVARKPFAARPWLLVLALAGFVALVIGVVVAIRLAQGR